MAKAKDPVCGMLIESETATGQSSYQGTTYSFCSTECLRQFEAEPERYVASSAAPTADANVELERHEPPFTKSKGFVAPKFGSAGSGGLEYERLPEAHDKQ